MISPVKRLAAVAAVSLALAGWATNASAIRNRYTNEQNEGFAALFVEAFGSPGFDDGEPVYRGRPADRRGIGRRYERRDDAFGF